MHDFWDSISPKIWKGCTVRNFFKFLLLYCLTYYHNISLYIQLLFNHLLIFYLSIEISKYKTNRLYLCGHSAGAHLTAMILTQSHWQDNNLSKQISGIFIGGGITYVHVCYIKVLKSLITATNTSDCHEWNVLGLYT